MYKLFRSPLFYIFILALIIRVYKLDSFPVGVHVDEIKVGWNAISIWDTGADDHGDKLSIYYDSFGDFRPTGIFYFTAPWIGIFGRSIFTIRFATALIGALTVIPLYLISKRFIRYGSIAAFLLAISPWHVGLSRATNEVIISTFFALMSLYWFMQYFDKKNKRLIFASTLAITISYFTYHSIRFIAPPALLISYLFIDRKKQKTKSKFWIIPVIISVFLSVFFSIAKGGLARFNQVSVFSNVDAKYEINRLKEEFPEENLISAVYDNKVVTFTKHFITQYTQYFSGNFLIGNAGRPYRFATPGTGLITYIEFVLLIAGFIAIIQKRKNLFLIAMLLIAPLPGAFTSEDIPNLSRAQFMLPFIILIETQGFYYISNYYKNKFLVPAVMILLLLVNVSYFFWMYFYHSETHRPFLKDFFVDSPTYRNAGTLELVGQLDNIQERYDKIVITNFPDNPYPWYAFFTGKSPPNFNRTYSDRTNERIYGKIVFSEQKCPSDTIFTPIEKSNVLVVDNWECGVESKIKAGLPVKIVSTIKRSDGSIVYYLLERDWDLNYPTDLIKKFLPLLTNP